MTDDRSVLHIVNDSMTEEEEKNQKHELLSSRVLHEIRIKGIEHIRDGGFASFSSRNVDPMKTFSIVSKMDARHGGINFDFECVGRKQQEAIVTALRFVASNNAGKEQSLRMRRRSLPAFRGHSSAKVHPAALDVIVTPDAVLSPMQRTCVYAGSGSPEEGTELALYRTSTEEIETLAPRRKSLPTDAFNFSEVSDKQSLDEQQDTIGSSFSMLAASLREALDEWCSQDACIDLTDVAESLGDIFFLVQTQNKLVDSNTTYSNGQHVRSDSSSDMQVGTLCMTDFFKTPAAIWAELPSPNVSFEKQPSSTRDTRIIRNRASVVNAQAYRWKQLQTEMTFESVNTSCECLMPSIQTTKSWGDLDGTDERVASSQRIASGNFTDTSGYGLFELFPSGFWDDDDDPTDSENCYFYDSEPECARMLTRSKGPRHIKAEQLNKVTTSTKKKAQRLNFSIPRYMGSHFDDEYVTAIIEVSIRSNPLFSTDTCTYVLFMSLLDHEE